MPWLPVDINKPIADELMKSGEIQDFKYYSRETDRDEMYVLVSDLYAWMVRHPQWVRIKSKDELRNGS